MNGNAPGRGGDPGGGGGVPVLLAGGGGFQLAPQQMMQLRLPQQGGPIMSGPGGDLQLAQDLQLSGGVSLGPAVTPMLMAGGQAFDLGSLQGGGLAALQAALMVDPSGGEGVQPGGRREEALCPGTALHAWAGLGGHALRAVC